MSNKDIYKEPFYFNVSKWLHFHPNFTYWMKPLLIVLLMALLTVGYALLFLALPILGFFIV